MDAAASDRAVTTAARASLRVCAMDGALLGLFMISACLSVALFEHPSSPTRQWVGSEFARRAWVGVAMGLTAAGLIYSPWGKRSGALMNPALTLCFLRLGKLDPIETLGYVVAQFVGGTLGVALCASFFHSWVSHPLVHYVVTAPGEDGALVAWFGELGISFTMTTAVMTANRVPTLAPRTGLLAATLVTLFIAFEAPLSGMSMNPARSFASAVLARSFHGLWIYFTAPISGMLLATELQTRAARPASPCGKLSHGETSAGFVRCNCLDRTE